MKEIIVYFTMAGSTKTYAEKLKKERNADIYSLTFPKKPGVVKAFFLCPAAIQGKTAKINPIQVDFSKYDKITLVGPIWASHPAPPLNNALAAIPSGKKVELFLLSGSGQSKKEEILARIQSLGLKVEGYTDVKAGDL